MQTQIQDLKENQGAGYERLILGTALLHGRSALNKLFDLVDQVPGFRRTTSEIRHEDIWTVICELYEEGAPIEPQAVYERLNKSGNGENVSLIAVLLDLQKEATGSLSALPYYITGQDGYVEYRRKDELASGLLSLAGNATNGYTSEQVEAGVIQLLQRPDLEVGGSVRINEAIGEVIDSMCEGLREGIQTGLSDFDRVLAGLAQERVYVFGARPGMGKSSFALWIARKVAKGNAVGILSLEMSLKENIERFICAEAQMVLDVFRSGSPPHKDVAAKARTAANKIMDLPIFIDDTPAMSLSQALARARLWKQREDIGLLIIDHLQLIQHEGNTRNEAIGDITRALKALAKELKIPILVLSQLSRASEQRAEKRPQLSDLRDSGSVEQDADAVIFIYRPEVYVNDPSEKGICELIVSKNRAGRTGRVKVFCDIAAGVFGNLEIDR